METDERNQRFDTLQPGISISSKHSTNGTLGLIVFDKLNNYNPCILSNYHILGKGSLWRLREGSPIYQPGKNEKGRVNANIVARLVRLNKNLDAAIARIVARNYNLAQFGTGVVVTGARMPKEGDLVEKSGVRTGVTRGVIIKVNNQTGHTTIKPHNEASTGMVEISEGGDSGSVWYDPNTGAGLVLHCAGESKDAPDTAYGHALPMVLEQLSVSLNPG